MANTISAKLIATLGFIPVILASAAAYQYFQTEDVFMLAAVLLLLLSAWGVVGIAESVDSRLSSQTD